MAAMIYGVDPDKPVTAPQVRDAIISCFTAAHEEVLDMMKEFHSFSSEADFEEMKSLEIGYLIKSMFNEIGANFDNPSKDQLIQIVHKLADYARNFRAPEIINKHSTEIMALIGKLP